MTQSYKFHTETAARELLNGKHVSAARRITEQGIRTKDVEDVMEAAGVPDHAIIAYISEALRAM